MNRRIIPRWYRRLGVVIAVGACCAGAVSAVWAADDAVAAASVAPMQTYGGWVLLPPLVAIACAVVFRQVVPALFTGVLVAAWMLSGLPAGADLSDRLAQTCRLTAETYIVGAMADSDHVKVILFTMLIAGMVGVVGEIGATRALVDVVARHAATRRRGQLTGWLAGLVVFFDDYANSMIVGPTMQPVTDRLRISRAKLAYIVDSTAAPVASIALVGTWVGAEIGYIDDGLREVAAAGAPAFLTDVDAFGAFVKSIPYRFYAVLALLMVAIVAATGRDFGPMLRHERQAMDGDDGDAQADTSATAAASTSHWWVAALPVLILVAVTGAVLVAPGWQAWRATTGTDAAFRFRDWFADADSFNALLYGALAGVGTAVLLAVLTRASSLHAAVDAATRGMGRVLPAIVVLVLAWALSAAAGDLQVGEMVSGWLAAKGFALTWLPLSVFVSAAGVSFATGTSWGTMGILCPIVVRVSADLGATAVPEEALALFYASVGAVLSGAIFGDHCSPISDTTVLSSIASGCTLEDHVWTQLPYAAVVAIVAMLAGDTLTNRLGLSPIVGLLVGGVALVVIVRMLGRHSSPRAAR